MRLNRLPAPAFGALCIAAAFAQSPPPAPEIPRSPPVVAPGAPQKGLPEAVPRKPAARPAAGKVASGPPTKVTAVEGITEYRLPNGLQVLFFPDASKPTITVNVTYLVGSRHENYGETGMAHLL